MAFYPIQNSFMAGEISPRMLGRMDTPFYKHGVEFSENFMHLPQGPVRLRPGSQFAVQARQNGAVRLIPFNTPGYLKVSDYVLELGEDGTLRLINEDGVVQKSVSGQLILNNDFTQGATNWNFHSGTYSTVEWLGTTATVDLEVPQWFPDWDPGPGGPLHPPLPPPSQQPYIEQKLLNVLPGAYRLQVGFPAPTDDIAAGGNPIAVDVTIGTGPGLSDIYNGPNNYNTNLDVIINIVPGPGDVYIRFQMHSAVFPADGMFISRIVFPQLTGSGSGPCDITGLPWTAQMLPEIQYAQDVHFGMVLVHPMMPPQLVIYTGSTFTCAALPIFSHTGQPNWWPTNEYPSAVEIWQSRLWFGNTPSLPTTLWASHSATALSGAGSYEDFSVSGTPLPNEGLELILSSKGAIKWIRGKQQLLIGTELHEDVIVSTTQVITSGDAQLIRQSAFGSSFIQAQDIGDQVLFVSRDGVKLRSLNFNFDTQAWLAHDISFYAQGITIPGVKEIAFARDPDNTIFVLCTDGTMRMCTYDRLQEVVAWSRWRTAGIVQSICATIDPTGTTLWAAVQRNGTNFIEYVPPYTAVIPYFMDSYTIDRSPMVHNVGPIQHITINAGTHLNGYTVGVVMTTPNSSIPTYYGLQAVSGGVVDFVYSGPVPAVAVVGVPYVGTLRTLPLDGGVMYGSSAGLVKGRTKIFTRLLPGSVLPLINNQRPSERDPQTPMNTTAAVADIDNWIVNLGWDRYARVTLTADIPLECQIAGIFGRAEVTQL